MITVLQYIYTWLILQLSGRSGPTGTHGNSVLTTNPRAQFLLAGECLQYRDSLSEQLEQVRGECHRLGLVASRFTVTEHKRYNSDLQRKAGVDCCYTFSARSLISRCKTAVICGSVVSVLLKLSAEACYSAIPVYYGMSYK